MPKLTEQEIKEAKFQAWFELQNMDYDQEFTATNILMAILEGKIPHVRFEVEK